MIDNNDRLEGRKAISVFFNWPGINNKKRYKTWLSLGMPVVKRGGRIFASRDKLSEWFQSVFPNNQSAMRKGDTNVIVR